MSKIVDARGLSCPEPVIVTKNALQEAGEESLTVLVSNTVARDNVMRMVKKMGWSVIVEEDDEGFKLKLEKA